MTPQEEYLPMNPLHKELDYSNESSDDDSYTSMSHIKEMRSMDSKLSKSSEYLVDMAVDDDKSKDWADKGLTKSYSIQSQVRVINFFFTARRRTLWDLYKFK